MLSIAPVNQRHYMRRMRKPSITMVLTDEVLTAIDAIAEAEKKKRSRSQVADIVLRAGLAVVA